MSRALASGRMLARRARPPPPRRHLQAQRSPNSIASKMAEILPVHPSQPRWHLLHAGHTSKSTHRADASHAKPFLKPDEVDLLVKKIDDVARTTVLVEYTESLIREQKTKLVSPHLIGIALPWLVCMGSIGLFAAGYKVGYYRTIEKEDQDLKEKK